MNFVILSWTILKMLYHLLWCSISLFSFVFNVFWFVCNVASAGIPWFTLMLLIVCVASKFVKLRSPSAKRLLNFFETGDVATVDNLAYWPIANRAASYDAPGNSKAAIKKCITRGYRNVMLDAGLTACGEIVIVNRSTLERAGLTGAISQHALEELRRVNITSVHPLSSKFDAEYVYTLSELMEFLENNRLIIFLRISDHSSHMIEKLKAFIKKNAQFLNQIILISSSPYAIYQLRKTETDLVCGLWTEKFLALPILKASTLATSIYGAIYRNIIAPVVGVSVVFVNKDEFNLHIAELWRNVGVRPIVYNINSPNEKRYFQKTMKTQYLTDSLRSEPHLLMKA
ncbi:glycerophosphodiester phosphodiesterase 1 [Teleopsis dalmanni]|uniref:glycerophosphodiester phosphodiesterase 1 n=1 Tax=Teleopsis dalmanni TaxID=139649 RepID=UPI0018CF7901|nr:glycerophosphodiester phosphodiesterase 1 [Teleopsis dalmanni]